MWAFGQRCRRIRVTDWRTTEGVIFGIRFRVSVIRAPGVELMLLNFPWVGFTICGGCSIQVSGLMLRRDRYGHRDSCIW